MFEHIQAGGGHHLLGAISCEVVLTNYCRIQALGLCFSIGFSGGVIIDVHTSAGSTVYACIMMDRYVDIGLTSVGRFNTG